MENPAIKFAFSSQSKACAQLRGVQWGTRNRDPYLEPEWRGGQPEFANSQKVHIDKSDAIEWLDRRLQGTHEGAVHVVYHTIAWQYFPKDTKKRGEAMLKTAGIKATKVSPLAWLRLEVDGEGAGLTLTLWPSGETQTLARGDFHGRWIDWQGWNLSI